PAVVYGETNDDRGLDRDQRGDEKPEVEAAEFRGGGPGKKRQAECVQAEEAGLVHKVGNAAGKKESSGAHLRQVRHKGAWIPRERAVFQIHRRSVWLPPDKSVLESLPDREIAVKRGPSA